MALFKSSAKIVPATTNKAEVVAFTDEHPVPDTQVITLLLKGDRITYHHISQTDVTKNECECKELSPADYPQLYGYWYGCIFCGFVVQPTKFRIDITSLKS